MNNAKKTLEKANDSCVKMANERFGLEVLAKALLSDSLCHDESISKIIRLAKDRKFNECSELIEKSKPTKVEIKRVTSAMCRKGSESYEKACKGLL